MSDTHHAESKGDPRSFGEMMQIAALVLPLGVVRAWAITDMWNWFIVPLGVPVVSIGQMFGIILMLRIIHIHNTNVATSLPSFKDAVQQIIIACSVYWIAWVVAKGVYLLTMV